jgi:hypothetical protein
MNLTTLNDTHTIGRTPLDEGSARNSYYLTTHNTHKRQISVPPAGLEIAIPARQRSLTYSLDCRSPGAVS